MYNRGHQRLLLHVKPAHLLRLELWTEVPKMCRSCVCLLCSVWGFFPLQLPFWFSKPASARLLYLWCLIFMYDSFAEKKKKKRKKGKCSSSPSPPCFPLLILELGWCDSAPEVSLRWITVSPSWHSSALVTEGRIPRGSNKYRCEVIRCIPKKTIAGMLKMVGISIPTMVAFISLNRSRN